MLKLKAISLLTPLMLVAECHAQSVPNLSAYKLLFSPVQAGPGSQPTTMLESAPGFFNFYSFGGSNPSGSSVWSITSNGLATELYTPPTRIILLSFVQATDGSLVGNALPNTGQTYYLAMTATGKNVRQYPIQKQGNSIFLTQAANGLFDELGYSNVTGNLKLWLFSHISANGTITPIYNFKESEGKVLPGSNLVYGSDGNIYGVATTANPLDVPTWVFRLTPAGQYSVVATIQPPFNASSTNPVVFGPDGNIYGTIGQGGAHGRGALWRATLSGAMSGTMEIVASFPAKGMTQPESLMAAGDGNLYGTTQSNFLFRYDIAAQTLQQVYQIPEAAGYPQCPCQLIHGSDGKFYGITPVGGNYPGVGAVFSLDTGLAKPKPVVNQVLPSSGAVGSQVLLFGGWLLGPTSVTFNGVPATGIVVTSSQSVYVTVPPGASSGPITIATPGGSFTTAQDFTVN